MTRTGILNTVTFNDTSAFGADITRVYRPVFQDRAGRQASVSPVPSESFPAFEFV